LPDCVADCASAGCGWLITSWVTSKPAKTVTDTISRTDRCLFRCPIQVVFVRRLEGTTTSSRRRTMGMLSLFSVAAIPDLSFDDIDKHIQAFIRRFCCFP